ncbi:hypothetical protein K470DRAFT_282545 [Piedraia hortae CBS 480.64]|uniref:BTB domain-containing protein n=1 Tax=Piedraia hortae CBS 480.64 TaxID=1314780 RepID=A0A6A7BY72_9PEZI|nr:hypothetical protein K470DRAFT_282545 [Piedraia hortae CBS 480.64]
MTAAAVLDKHQLEQALYEERQAVSSGALKEENPLDTSGEFRALCEACRRGDLRSCQEQIDKCANINAKDEYDYTPLILASLCGHYEVVRMLLEQGARCERDTFQGERCLYNALNDRIRDLLLSYDYAKSTDPLQPLAAHITSLLGREQPRTSDIAIVGGETTLQLHKFILSARSPYMRRELSKTPNIKKLRLEASSASIRASMRFLYLSELGAEWENAGSHEIGELSKRLEVPQLEEHSIQTSDRRVGRQRRTAELERARDQLEVWLDEHVIKHKFEVDSNKIDEVRWELGNSAFADVLLRAEDEAWEDKDEANRLATQLAEVDLQDDGKKGKACASMPGQRRSTLYPAHRAMLLRSEVFATMFSSPFREGQENRNLQVIPVDCSPEVLEIVLRFLYTEQATFPLSLALKVLQVADMLFIERLKQRAALLISTLGNGTASVAIKAGDEQEEEDVNIYDIVRVGWDTRVQRLEEFGARYLAYRLERYIEEPEFQELVLESASRITRRQEIDSVELIDDIRYYLSERFRLRMEDSGLNEMLDDEPNPEGKESRPTNEQPQTDFAGGRVRALNDELAGDEFAQNAIDYQILLDRIDRLMEHLGLDG